MKKVKSFFGRCKSVVFFYVFLKACIFHIKAFPSLARNIIRTRSIYKKKYFGKVICPFYNEAIGPMAEFAELSLRRMKVKNMNPKKDVVFITDSDSCNVQLRKMFERETVLEKDPRLYRALLGGGRIYLKMIGRLFDDHLKNGTIFYPQSSLNFHFTSSEKLKGRRLLKRLGVKPKDTFVVVHNKDDIYWKEYRGKNKLWDSYRNTDFSDLHPCISHLQDLGIKVIRSGHYEDAEGDLPYISLNSLEEDDKAFIDVYIQKHCLFSVNGGSGIAWIPYLFKKPVLFHNFIPMGESPALEDGIMIPKLLRWKKTGKFLTISEMLEIKEVLGCFEKGVYRIRNVSADAFQSSNLYRRNGIEPIDNPPGDVLQGIVEMLQYVKGELHLEDKQREMQEKFKESFPVGHPMRHFMGFVSPSFLSKHQDLIDCCR